MQLFTNKKERDLRPLGQRFHCSPRFAAALTAIFLANFQLSLIAQTNLFSWAAQAGGTGRETARRLALDGDNSCYVTGTFGDNFGTNISFGSNTLVGTHDGAIFLAKYDPDGAFRWARKLGGGCCLDRARAMTVNASGSSYIAGSIGGKIFTAKHSSDGDLLWLEQLSTDGCGQGICVNPQDDTFVISVSGGSFGRNLLSVAKRNSHGVLQWVRQVLDGNGDSDSIALDRQGNIYVAGDFSGAAIFGGQVLNESGGETVFLVKLNGECKVVWVRLAPRARSGLNDYDESGIQMAMGEQDSIYLAGDFGDFIGFGATTLTSDIGSVNLFLARYDTDGNVSWARSIQTGGHCDDCNFVRGIAANAVNSVLVCGSFTGAATFGDLQLSGKGTTSGFVAEYTSFGESVWAQAFGGSFLNSANSIALDEQQNCYVAGFFQTTAAFGTTTLISRGLEDAFVAKRERVLPVIQTAPTNQVVFAGSPVRLQSEARSAAPSLAERLIFQWDKDGHPMIGETNSVLTLVSAAPNDAGKYSVTVSNSDGSVVSAPSTLTVVVSLTVSTNGNGWVTGQPTESAIIPSTTVSLMANPAEGFGFLGWSGDAEGISNPLLVVMNTNKSVTATFVSTRLVTNVKGSGTISGMPELGFYSLGDEVTMLATPGRWHEFSKWTDGNVSNPRSITIGASNVYTAVFTETVPLEWLTFGGVTRLAPVGMPAIFLNGQFVVAGPVTNGSKAQISLRSSFTNATVLYSLDGSEPSFASALYAREFTVTNSVSLRVIAYSADFSQSVASDPLEVMILPGYKLDATTLGGGGVRAKPSQEIYLRNSIVTLEASPALGWTFLSWEGDLTSTNMSVSLVMDAGKSIRAVFGTRVSTFTAGEGSLLLEPIRTFYPYSSRIRVMAVPGQGSYFALWGNAATGTSRPLDFLVNRANATISALFAALPTNNFSITPLVVGSGRVTQTPASPYYTNGQRIVLTALPATNSVFTGWTGDASGDESPLILLVDRSKTLTANFQVKGSAPPKLAGSDSSRGFELFLTGDPNVIYVIQGSTNLTDWVPLTSITNLITPVRFLDIDSERLDSRFYRAFRP
ncbi:MAG: chitobiase/beta-hexosaminidase C-terminal domain-containing protein [Verrucomicrobiia bacterium]